MFKPALSFAAVVVLSLVSQSPQTPIFRGSADVVVAGVQVTDRRGAPVSGLTASDFELKVDGRPRPITSVTFERLSDRPATAATDAFSTIASLDSVQAESFVLLVVDPQSMHMAPSRRLFDQAAVLMKTLPAAHAVGLMIVPARTPQYPFSTLREPIAAALRQQTGRMPMHPVVAEQLAAANASRVALEAGIEALRRVDGRRTLVYVADGLAGTSDGSLEAVIDRAREADVTIHLVASDAPTIQDVTSRRPPPPPPVTGGDFGMAGEIAERTGGMIFRRATSGSVVLDRLERVLSARYVLAFNVEDADRDGKRHTIDVRVNRKNLDVRFRKEFVR